MITQTVAVYYKEKKEEAYLMYKRKFSCIR